MNTDRCWLALDASTDTCSVAVQGDGQLAVRTHQGRREHARAVLAMVDEVLGELGADLGDVDGLVFGAGPGSFTGVRLSIAMCQGLAMPGGWLVAGMSSLRAAAQAAAAAGAAGDGLVIEDAHMGEAFAGRYRIEQGLAVAAGGDRLLAPDALQADGAAWVAGGGVDLCPALASVARVAPESTLALAVALLDIANREPPHWVPVTDARAIYLRPDAAIATPPGAR